MNQQHLESPPTDDDEMFGLEAPDLDVEAIMQEIRARIRARRAEAKSLGLDFEAYADGLYPLPPGAVLSRETYEAVRHVSLGYDKVSVAMVLTETRIPVVGGLVQRIRAALHGLVLFYVNQIASQQTRFNERTAHAVTALVRDLEAEIRDIHARLAALEVGQE